LPLAVTVTVISLVIRRLQLNDLLLASSKAPPANIITSSSILISDERDLLDGIAGSTTASLLVRQTIALASKSHDLTHSAALPRRVRAGRLVGIGRIAVFKEELAAVAFVEGVTAGP
jgi:hypothetical protein